MRASPHNDAPSQYLDPNGPDRCWNYGGFRPESIFSDMSLYPMRNLCVVFGYDKQLKKINMILDPNLE